MVRVWQVPDVVGDRLAVIRQMTLTMVVLVHQHLRHCSIFSRLKCRSLLHLVFLILVTVVHWQCCYLLYATNLC